MELLASARNKLEQRSIKKGLLRFNTSLINDEISLLAVKLFESYKLSHGLSIPDCFIATTSIVLNLDLFTYNIKNHQFIRNLALYEF